MSKEFWACNLFQLNQYKNDDVEDLIEKSYSFINYIKEIFPVNKVPENIANSLESLEDRILLTKEQYRQTVDKVCLEIQIIMEKEVSK